VSILGRDSGLEVQPVSCPVGTGGSLPGDKGYDAEHSLPHSAEVKNGGVRGQSPICLKYTSDTFALFPTTRERIRFEKLLVACLIKKNLP
jgi:hypothetical protein